MSDGGKMIGLEEKMLRSERLSYRLMRDSDSSALRRILSSPEVSRPAGFLPVKSDEEFSRFFEKITMYKTCVAVLSGDALVGYVHVGKYRVDSPAFEGKSCVGLGFAFGREYWGKGYATEAVKTVTGYLLSRFDCCFADCFVENVASARVIEKCGYKYMEDYTMFFEALGEEHTCHSYFHM